MAARNPLTVVLLAGLACGALGFLLGQAFAPAAGSARHVSLAAGPGDGGPRSAQSERPLELEPGGASPSSASRRASADAERFAPSRAAVDRAVADVDAPDIVAASGSGSITGRVVDRAGAAIPGAVVRVDRDADGARLSDPSEIGRAENELPDLEAYLRERAEDWAELRSRRQVTATDGTGAFALEGLDTDATYRVRASAEGYTLMALGRTRGVECGASIDFVAEPIHVVRVDLRGPGGEPLTEGAVQVRRGGRDESFAWSPDNAELRLSPGPCILRGYGRVFADAASVDDDVDAELASEEHALMISAAAEATVQEVVLEVRPRLGIRGRTVGGGETAGNMTIRFRSLLDGEVPDLEMLATLEPRSWGAETFAFYDLVPGRYVVAAGPPWGEIVAHEVVELNTGIAEIELVLDDAGEQDLYTVHALDPDGLRVYVENVHFEAKYSNGNSRESGMTLVRRDLESSLYTIDHGDVLDEATLQSLTISAIDRIYGRCSVEVGPAQRDVVLQFEAPVSIVGQVAGFAATGLSGRLRIGVWSIDPDQDSDQADGNFWQGLNTARAVPASGEVRHDGLAPGRYMVGLYLGQRWDARLVESREVAVDVGESVVAFDSPTLYDVRVIAPGLYEGAVLYLSEKSEGGRRGRMRGWGGGNTARVDGLGNALFRDLLPGEYSLGSNEAQNSMDVTVPSSDVLFEVRTHDAVRISISDVEGHLHAAGLRSGDLVLSIAGVPLGDGDAMEQAINSLYNGGAELVLSVLRRGQQVQVSLPPFEQDSGVPWGGRARSTFSDD